jgi:hypothetical protein
LTEDKALRDGILCVEWKGSPCHGEGAGISE